MGRKYKPNNLKKLSGSRYYRPDVPAASGAPHMPPGKLSEQAKWAWRYIVPKLEELGVLDETDMFVIMALCDAVGDFVWASEMIANGDAQRVIRTTNGNLIQSPLAGIKNTARKAMYDMACAMGLSPADREKLFANMGEDEDAGVLAEFVAAMNG